MIVSGSIFANFEALAIILTRLFGAAENIVLKLLGY